MAFRSALYKCSGVGREVRPKASAAGSVFGSAVSEQVFTFHGCKAPDHMAHGPRVNDLHIDVRCGCDSREIDWTAHRERGLS